MKPINIADIIIDRKFSNLDDLSISPKEIMEYIPYIDNKIQNMEYSDPLQYDQMTYDQMKSFLSFIINTFGKKSKSIIRKLSKKYNLSDELSIMNGHGAYYISKYFPMTKICDMVKLYVDIYNDCIDKRFINSIIDLLSWSLSYFARLDWMEYLSPDILDRVYPIIRHDLICMEVFGYFTYVDAKYYKYGGTKMFDYHNICNISLQIDMIKYTDHEQDNYGLLSNDILNFDLSYDDWIRVKNEILKSLTYNMNNINLVYDIVNKVGIGLSNHDIDIIRRYVLQSDVPLRDFSSYGYILMMHNINLTEINKDIFIFLSRGGDISTINILINNSIHISYDMMTVFANEYDGSMYEVFNDRAILELFISVIDTLNPAVVIRIASIILSDDVYNYPSELVDYMISCVGYTINDVSDGSYTMLSYLLSKKCDIDEILILRDKLRANPNILEYIPIYALKYIPETMLFDAMKLSNKFNWNVKKYLIDANIKIPDDVIDIYPGYASTAK